VFLMSASVMDAASVFTTRDTIRGQEARFSMSVSSRLRSAPHALERTLFLLTERYHVGRKRGSRPPLMRRTRYVMPLIVIRRENARYGSE
jgi:hypothetical protein